jgi:branched-chain amino acid aminotransferase
MSKLQFPIFFESMLCEGGTIHNFDLHLNRIQSITKRFGLKPILFDADDIRQNAIKKMQKLNLSTAKLRLSLEVQDTTLSIKSLEVIAIDSNQNEPSSIQLVTFPVPKDSENPFSNFKTENSLLYKDSIEYALSKDTTQALIVNERSEVVETSICNILFVKDKTIYTPSLHSGCINGVMRKKLIKEKNIVERTILLSEISNYDAAFASNAVRGIIPIIRIDEVGYNIDVKI